MGIRLERRTDPDGSLVIIPIGDLDRDFTEPLAAAVNADLRKSPPRLVVELTRVPFCDSSGIVALFDAHDDASRLGVEFVLTGVGGHLRELFRISALDQVIRIVEESHG
ncbi:STAS domain-containing protein [Streptosporangium sp. NPDC023615]|uniref:STAS domain-containing protein n=1 Tax=Streptosporangium sp. NPDC023615 TaxID=3154794 RepID=UPI00342F4125